MKLNIKIPNRWMKVAIIGWILGVVAFIFGLKDMGLVFLLINIPAFAYGVGVEISKWMDNVGG